MNEDRSTSLGDGNANHGDGSANSGDGNASHGDGNVSHGDGNVSHGDGRASNGDATVSHGDGNVSYGDANANHGDGNASQGDGNASQGDGNASQGDGNASHGDDGVVQNHNSGKRNAGYMDSGRNGSDLCGSLNIRNAVCDMILANAESNTKVVSTTKHNRQTDVQLNSVQKPIHTDDQGSFGKMKTTIHVTDTKIMASHSGKKSSTQSRHTHVSEASSQKVSAQNSSRNIYQTSGLSVWEKPEVLPPIEPKHLPNSILSPQASKLKRLPTPFVHKSHSESSTDRDTSSYSPGVWGCVHVDEAVGFEHTFQSYEITTAESTTESEVCSDHTWTDFSDGKRILSEGFKCGCGSRVWVM